MRIVKMTQRFNRYVTGEKVCLPDDIAHRWTGGDNPSFRVASYVPDDEQAKHVEEAAKHVEEAGAHRMVTTSQRKLSGAQAETMQAQIDRLEAELAALKGGKNNKPARSRAGAPPEYVEPPPGRDTR